jgi:DNA-binding NtrC family response regulator
MDENSYVVVACSNWEDRTFLIHVLEKLSLDVISCSSLDQIHEELARRSVSLVFCDENLSEGCFRDLVSAATCGRRGARIVVTIRAGEWDEYLRVIGLGAYDALRCPLQPTDVELVVLRAMREKPEEPEQRSYRKTA